MRPQFVMKGNHVYKSEYHPDVRADAHEGTKALYVKRGEKLYASAAHPDAGNPHAMYHIREGKVFTTMDHPQHNPDMHVFELGAVKSDPSFIKRVIDNA
jgi:hypothetical protein